MNDPHLLQRLKQDSLYQILGVEESSTPAEIKTAYKSKALEYHPDKHNNDVEKTEQFQKIQNAYDTLCDENARKQYDSERAAKIAEVILLLQQDLFRMIGNAFAPK